ncbi:acylase [Duganella sp. FT135W]|uniref:Acylase n=1 Tax=Duganella flavida TaxID=2692175 RepID=A0A6L8KJP1_9BURK|nr:acylase [Duganella flavida]MYM26428.1 acylase [Duganella flavida]
MRIPLALLCLVSVGAAATAAAEPVAPVNEGVRLKVAAKRVTILRDKWGIPHIYGKTDADAVFGMVYAQAEDDFHRVELNFINAMGRLAEVEGEAELYKDLRMKLFITPDELKRQYAQAPVWLKKLMNAWADGLNYYLQTHPEVKPALLTHFEPWMALSFSEGSIGGDIETVDIKQLQALYADGAKLPLMSPVLVSSNDGIDMDKEPGGSNGFAIAPSRTKNGRALLMINPHTSFYFRPEIQVHSEQGLNAYGAVTWGQFFVYQGFNDRVGWMHTSGGGDVIDEYLETISEKDGQFFYQYGSEQRPLKAVDIALPYKTKDGMASKTVRVYYSHHGPIVRVKDGKWVAVRLMNEPLKALTQSFIRTKARSYKDFYKSMELRTNSSNNTVYADADGNIAYFHGNFVPRRDPQFDWKHPVDGSNPATEWKGLHVVKETITLFNPKNGWIQNTNNWPYTVAGPYSPKVKDYPAYMSMNPENPRGIHAVRVLENKKDFTVDSLIAAAYDSQLPAFEPLLPQLFAAYDELPADDARKAALAPQIAALRGWNMRYSLESTATSLAIYWAQDLWTTYQPAAKAKEVQVLDYIQAAITPQQRLEALEHAVAKLTKDFGNWQTPWGEINRFQRLTGDVVQPFDDSKPSLPVAFASANWGSLAAYGMTTKQTTKRIYGERGNSFVAAVEFGPRIKARSILAGGQSGNPASPHFYDQAAMYARGEFKDVLFYKADVEKNLERRYHPGE